MQIKKVISCLILCIIVSIILFLGGGNNKKHLVYTKNDNNKVTENNLYTIGCIESEKAGNFSEDSQEIVFKDKKDDTTKIYNDALKLIVEKNKKIIDEFLKEFPKEDMYKWFDIFCFDFNRDGIDEIILSKSYVEASGIISYNHVYDTGGNTQFEFLSLGVPEIYDNEKENIFYIHSKAYITGRNIIGVYWEVSGLVSLKARLIFVEWDTRIGKEQVDKITEGYYIFTHFSREEIEEMGNGLNKMIELFTEKNHENETIDIENYHKKVLDYLQKEFRAIGNIYCRNSNIYVEDNDGNVLMSWR